VVTNFRDLIGKLPYPPLFSELALRNGLDDRNADGRIKVGMIH